MGKIGGQGSKQIGDYLLRFCFDRRLLQEFSFTGISKNRNVAPKPAFKAFPKTIRFIFKVIYNGDKSYTLLKNDQYLKMVFKHAPERSLKRRRTIESDEEDGDNQLATKIMKTSE